MAVRIYNGETALGQWCPHNLIWAWATFIWQRGQRSGHATPECSWYKILHTTQCGCVYNPSRDIRNWIVLRQTYSDGFAPCARAPAICNRTCRTCARAVTTPSLVMFFTRPGQVTRTEPCSKTKRVALGELGAFTCCLDWLRGRWRSVGEQQSH